MTAQEQFTDALHFIKHHQDGEVAETLRYRGLKYNMIYGVSSSLLYTYAKKIGKNQDLSTMLWKEGFREAKILSLMVADPEQISPDEIDAIVASFKNHEMVEIASLHVLPKLPFAVSKAYQWIESPEEFTKMTGYMLINRLARNLQSIKANELIKFLPVYERDFANSSYFVRNAVVNSFQEVAYRNPGIKGSIEEATKRVLNNNIGNEIELQAKDMLQVLKYC